MIEVLTGSLEEIEGFNGFYLYGQDSNGNTIFIHQLGIEPLGCDPNDDCLDLELAYNFTLV